MTESITVQEWMNPRNRRFILPDVVTHNGTELISMKEAAERCGCSLWLVEKNARQGNLPTVMIPHSRRKMIDSSKVAQWWEARQCKA